MTYYWYGLDPVITQALTAVEFCVRQEVTVLVSGDAVADVYAPWRLPVRAVLYTVRFVDLSVAGFSPAIEAEHILAVQVRVDPTLWRLAEISEPVVASAPAPAVDDPLVRVAGSRPALTVASAQVPVADSRQVPAEGCTREAENLTTAAIFHRSTSLFRKSANVGSIPTRIGWPERIVLEVLCINRNAPVG